MTRCTALVTAAAGLIAAFVVGWRWCIRLLDLHDRADQEPLA